MREVVGKCATRSSKIMLYFTGFNVACHWCNSTSVCMCVLLQPCQESLFTTLVKEFRSVLPQVIMDLVREVGDEIIQADDLPAVLRRDAGLSYSRCCTSKPNTVVQ